MHYTEGYLQGQFLIAAPAIQDERFAQSVLYVYKHDKNGAAALVLNKPSEFIDFPELCEQLSIQLQPTDPLHILCDGGPLEGNRGYVLHSNDFTGRDTINIDNSTLSLTTTVDIIKNIAEKSGPSRFLICLGYAGWEANQLEQEMTRHGWLHAPADEEIIFDVPHNEKWQKTISKMGFDFGSLAEYTGSA